MASPHSPLDVATFTAPELRAAVEAAENWGTYVTVHVYTPETIRRSVDAGVKCVEHGHLMDDPRRRLLAERGIWLSIHPFPPPMADVFPRGSDEWRKAQEVLAGTDTAYNFASKSKIKTRVRHRRPLLPGARAAAGTASGQIDPLVHAIGGARHGDRTNAELLALSGKRSPYRGKLGVVDVGALADLLLVDGNPREHQARRRPGAQLRGRRERRQGLQEPRASR